MTLDHRLLLLGALSFACMAVLDFALVRHQQATARRHRVAAGAWSVVSFAVGLVVTVAAIDVTLWLAVPSAAGLFVGNYLALAPEKGAS